MYIYIYIYIYKRRKSNKISLSFFGHSNFLTWSLSNFFSPLFLRRALTVFLSLSLSLSSLSLSLLSLAFHLSLFRNSSFSFQ